MTPRNQVRQDDCPPRKITRSESAQVWKIPKFVSNFLICICTYLLSTYPCHLFNHEVWETLSSKVMSWRPKITYYWQRFFKHIMWMSTEHQIPSRLAIKWCYPHYTISKNSKGRGISMLLSFSLAMMACMTWLTNIQQHQTTLLSYQTTQTPIQPSMHPSSNHSFQVILTSSLTVNLHNPNPYSLPMASKSILWKK